MIHPVIALNKPFTLFASFHQLRCIDAIHSHKRTWQCDSQLYQWITTWFLDQVTKILMVLFVICYNNVLGVYTAQFLWPASWRENGRAVFFATVRLLMLLGLMLNSFLRLLIVWYQLSLNTNFYFLDKIHMSALNCTKNINPVKSTGIMFKFVRLWEILRAFIVVWRLLLLASFPVTNNRIYRLHKRWLRALIVLLSVSSYTTASGSCRFT